MWMGCGFIENGPRENGTIRGGMIPRVKTNRKCRIRFPCREFRLRGDSNLNIFSRVVQSSRCKQYVYSRLLCRAIPGSSVDTNS